MSLAISGRSNNLSILHHFQDITTFTVYVTACDLKKSLNFDITVKSHAIYVFRGKHTAANTCYILGVTKVLKS